MSQSTPERSFPLPSQIADVPGAEGWEAMYPYFTRFQPEDDTRFWFYNSMHFPEVVPAFDGITSEIPYTATRVFALYRVNTAFAGDALAQLEASPAARFDVQVTQSLPFLDFTSAQWEMLFGIRNMVRELVADGSVYDELLVVRPPKRVVGGLTVRF